MHPGDTHCICYSDVNQPNNKVYKLLVVVPVKECVMVFFLDDGLKCVSQELDDAYCSISEPKGVIGFVD